MVTENVRDVRQTNRSGKSLLVVLLVNRFCSLSDRERGILVVEPFCKTIAKSAEGLATIDPLIMDSWAESSK